MTDTIMTMMITEVLEEDNTKLTDFTRKESIKITDTLFFLIIFFITLVKTVHYSYKSPNSMILSDLLTK